MADVHDRTTRSYNMSRIKGKDTKPEEIVRKYLFSRGYRFRKNDKRYPGTPDIVLPKYKTMVLINGCFWHGHVGCKYFVWPKTNPDFWKEKIERNIERDQKNIEYLRQAGWKVYVIWECELNTKKREDTLSRLITEMEANSERNE